MRGKRKANSRRAGSTSDAGGIEDELIGAIDAKATFGPLLENLHKALKRVADEQGSLGSLNTLTRSLKALAKVGYGKLVADAFTSGSHREQAALILDILNRYEEKPKMSIDVTASQGPSYNELPEAEREQLKRLALEVAREKIANGFGEAQGS